MKNIKINISNKKVLHDLIQFIKFGIVGLSNNVIYYLVYILLIRFSINYLIANSIAFLISVINAYYWNSKYVFNNKKENQQKGFKVFGKMLISYGFTGFILNNILLVIWVSLLSVPKEIAPIINLIITVPINFILNKFWTYRKKN